LLFRYATGCTILHGKFPEFHKLNTNRVRGRLRLELLPEVPLFVLTMVLLLSSCPREAFQQFLNVRVEKFDVYGFVCISQASSFWALFFRHSLCDVQNFLPGFLLVLDSFFMNF